MTPKRIPADPRVAMAAWEACESCSLGGEVCKHIRACREAWPEEQRANGRTS